MNELEKYKIMCKKLHYPEGKMTNEYLFTLYGVDLFYFNRNIGELDIKYGYVDGNYDGGIDFIHANPEVMRLVQGKSSSTLTIEDIKNIFNKMIDTVIKFEKKNYDPFSKTLKSAYLNAYDHLNDDKNIELILFTNTEISKDLRKKVQAFFDDEVTNNFDYFLFDINDIELKRAVTEQGDLVEAASIELNETNNALKYGENGLIVNIKASSLKRLYTTYGENGLFSYNLREHIAQKSVDDGIGMTIKKEKDNFWFYNNGITIGCNSFYIDGYSVKLYDFSIINGAQTTTKIGNSTVITEDNDFAIICKIVKAEKNVPHDASFITKISETSNSQKPIRARDLKSNANEQKTLQSKSMKNTYPLSIEIKRGVKPLNYKKVEKWQRVTNEYIGQLIYACIFQKPGPARNAKTLLFSSNKVYKQVYQRKMDNDTLYDLVRLGYIYDEYVITFHGKSEDIDSIAIVRNGKLAILAIILYLYKKEKKAVNDSHSSNLHKDNVKGLLITDYKHDDLNEVLYKLFDFIVRVLKHIYGREHATLKLTSYSNFFKSELIYEDVILKEFDGLDAYDQDKLSELLIVFREKKETI